MCISSAFFSKLSRSLVTCVSIYNLIQQKNSFQIYGKLKFGKNVLTVEEKSMKTDKGFQGQNSQLHGKFMAQFRQVGYLYVDLMIYAWL